jgi:hypothetical protein
MLLKDPQANIEIANLLTGPRTAFDYLLDALDIDSTTTSPAMLNLTYHSQAMAEDISEETWRLTGGEWWADQLLLHFQGLLPNLQGAELVIAKMSFPLKIHKSETRALELILTAEASSMLTRPVPLVIRWKNNEAIRESNPIFVCNRASLDAALELSSDGERLDRIGDLDLEDKEIEELLADLHEGLVIDRRSVWQLAGRTVPANTGEDDTSLYLDYANIDYDKLRQHPKIQQYFYGTAGENGYTRSRLQIILNAIIAHFQLQKPIAITSMEKNDIDPEESDDIPLQEYAALVEDKQGHSWSSQQRINRILKNFIHRYLRGLQSSDFQEFVGVEVIAQNYIVFTHLLWRLFAKDWVEPAFIVDALLQS